MSPAETTKAVRRALRRARWLHWALVGLILLLALGTLRNGGRLQSMKVRDAESRRMLALSEVRQLRERAEPGWLEQARTNILAARQIRVDVDLRDEWLACLVKAGDARSRDPIPCRLLVWPPVLRRSEVAFRYASAGVLLGCTERGWVEWHLDAPLSAPRLVPVPPRIPGTLIEATNVADGLGLRVDILDHGDVRLVGVAENRTVASLRGLAVHRASSVAWSPGGQWLAVAGHAAASPGSEARVLELWNLPVLRRGLAELQLDWSDHDPGAAMVTPKDPERWIKVTRVVLGALLVLLVAIAAIGNQHAVFRRYEIAERAAQERAQELAVVRERMMHAEKMRALGTLAAGVAHDFNNLLSVIQMSRQLVERAVCPTGVTREHLDNIRQAVEQGRAVVRSVLGYSRDTDDTTRSYGVAELIDGVLPLLRRQFLAGIEIEVSVAPGLPPVPARRSRLEQVLLNLVVNAGEAMNGCGRLRVRAELVSEIRSCLRPPAGSGPWLELEVADSGPGIPAEVMPRIFEPFFTTKTLGNQRGTGLGLATVWRIAEEEGFGLHLASEPGWGTAFRVFVPVQEGGGDAPAGKQAKPSHE